MIAAILFRWAALLAIVGSIYAFKGGDSFSHGIGGALLLLAGAISWATANSMEFAMNGSEEK